MKKNALRWILMFLCLILLPSLSWPMVSRFADTNNYEKRELAIKPSYEGTGFQQYARAYDDYYKDHLPFRNDLLQLYSMLEYSIFNESFAADVLVGKEGYLFFQGEKKASIKDLCGTNLFVPEELESIRQNLLDTQEYLNNRDIEFVLFIAPNKESIYSQYLPDYILERKAEYTRAMQLVAYLESTTDIRVVFPQTKLWEASLEADVYCRLDSHWNNLGAYIGTRELLKELGVSMPKVSELTLERTNESNKDLAAQLGLMRYLNTEVNYNISGYNRNTITLETGENAGFNTYYRYSSDAADQRKIMMNRDSFADAMIPFMASSFAQVYMPNYYHFTPDLVETEDPDVFIFEVTERRLSILTSFYMKEPTED